MLILAFDTTSEYGGVAIYRDRDCLASVPNPGPANYYSVTLFEMAERALAKAKPRDGHALGLRDIELFAVASGPGSFTGIRVGLAAAQGWTRAFNRPVKGISVLEAMVEQARPGTEWAVPILDARRSEFFLGHFRRLRGQNTFQADREGLVLKPEALRSHVRELLGEHPESAMTCIAREKDCAAQAFQGSLPDGVVWQTIRAPVLGAIARLALRAWREGNLAKPSDLNACYIRRPDADTPFGGGATEEPRK